MNRVSTDEIKKRPLIQVTEWMRPGEQMESQYGKVTTRAWVEMEVCRIRDAGSWAVLKYNPDDSGRVALFAVPTEKW